MSEQITRYGIGTTVDLPYEQALGRVRAALATEGFGVLSEVRIDDALRSKLGVAFRPYVILGACNPPLAYQALTAERDIGLLLPCNVIVYAADAPDQSVVAAMDPVEALGMTGNAAIEPLAHEVRARLVRVLDAVGSVAHVEHGASSFPAGACDTPPHHIRQPADRQPPSED